MERNDSDYGPTQRDQDSPPPADEELGTEIDPGPQTVDEALARESSADPVEIHSDSGSGA